MAGPNRWPPRLVLLLSGFGAAVAAYLTWVRYSGAEAICTGGGACEAVSNSAFADIFGVPIALPGLGLYLLLLLTGAWWLRAASAPGGGDVAARLSDARLATFGLALTGVAFSAYLTYLELFVIYAI